MYLIKKLIFLTINIIIIIIMLLQLLLLRKIWRILYI